MGDEDDTVDEEEDDPDDGDGVIGTAFVWALAFWEICDTISMLVSNEEQTINKIKVMTIYDFNFGILSTMSKYQLAIDRCLFKLLDNTIRTNLWKYVVS